MLLDLVLTYDCNLACDYCTITDAMRRRSLPLDVAIRSIDRAASRGVHAVAFTGGEPTIVEALPKLIAYARSRGFDDIKVSSNGLRYAYAPYLELLHRCGVTRFHVSMHARADADYDVAVQRAGAAELRRQAIQHLVERKLNPVADLILTKTSLLDLEGWIGDLRAQGIARFRLWLVSLTDKNAPNVEMLPRLEDAAPTLMRVFDAARAEDYEVLSLHVPRCFLPGHEAHVAHPGEGGVMVVTPDSTFDLASSRLTGGVKPAACASCRYEGQCPGLRADYVARHGDAVYPNTD